MGNNHSSAYPGIKPRKNVHWKTAEKPGCPGKPEIIPLGSEDEPNAVTLRWAMPRHDGGAPLLGFQVECNRIGSPAWIHTSPPVINKPELILTGLEGGYRYQFRVSAVNAVSASDPSELSDILTISSDRTAFTAPVFITHLEDVVALENDTSTFKTTFDGVPPPTVAWFKDGFEIFSSRRTAIATDENSSVLVFHQTLLSDEGEIKCTATNRAGHAVTRAKLGLHAPPKLRYPRQYEDGLLYEVNETIFLKTSVVGQPTPEVEWWHDGQPIATEARIEITNTSKLSALRIRAAKRSDRGEYQVHARNNIGEDSAAFLVTVTAPPEPPKNLVITRQIDKSVTLAWSPPEDDGGCRVGNYVLEYFRSGWDVWLKATTSRKLSATLFDLIEGSEYRFRVKAESPYGMSDPSEESTSIRIPGESIDSHFLAVESRIISDALRREDGEDAQLGQSESRPQVVQRRKKKNDATKTEPEKLTRLQAADSHDARIGSTEFMLVLYPEKENSEADKRKSFQLDLEDALSPPPLSFSAPELNTRYTGFAPLRNSVSSTELLHERAMDRFYKAYAMREKLNMKAKAEKDEMKKEVLANNLKPMNQLPEKEKTPPQTLERTKSESSEKFLQEPTKQKWQSNSFDDDYTASTVSTDDSQEISRETSVDGDLDRQDQLPDEEGTYNPRGKIMSSPSPQPERAVEVLTKPAPLPDPNFVPKPILKRRENEIVEQTQQPGKKPERKKLFSKIPKMSDIPKISKSFPFTKKQHKIESDKLNNKLESTVSNKNDSQQLKNVDINVNKELDDRNILIEYYGNIVKEYGGKKKITNQLYLNTEDLKKVAEKQQTKNTTLTKSSLKTQKISKTQKNPAGKPKVVAKTKTTISMSRKQPSSKGTVIAKTENKEMLNREIEPQDDSKQLQKSQIHESNNDQTKPMYQQIVLKTAARASIIIPIDYETLEQQAKHSVRSALYYTVDFCLLLLAFWFYFFKDERLAIPLLGLLVYRQVQQVVFQNIPEWIDNHTPAWMKTKQS